MDDPANAWRYTSRGNLVAVVTNGTAVLGLGDIGPLAAKPVIDLLGTTGQLSQIEAARPALAALGYRWRGENGITGRRYFTRDDPDTGTRRVHLHVHASDDPAVARHLAFRDRLRAEPGLAEAYLAEKRRCAALHPGDSGAYTACKAGWIAGLSD